jgi:hypothetical protein
MSNRTEKPWGHEELLFLTDHHAIKLLVLEPGTRTSQQLHRVKLEDLRLESGSASVEFFVDGMATAVPLAGVPVVIKPLTVHRIVAGPSGAAILEISTPELSDVVRIEDDYGRGGDG